MAMVSARAGRPGACAPHSLLVAAAWLAAGAFAMPRAQADVPDVPAGRFQQVDCASLGLKDLGAGVECGRLEVPENRAATDSITLSLPTVIFRATAAERADDAVFYLHGGPGIATVENAARFVAGDGVKGVRRKRDFVFFDQRGTGQSLPALCPDFEAALGKLIEEAPPPAIDVPRKRAAAEACRDHLRRQGRDPASYTSTAIADDAEALRKALGYRQWNVYGTSYGSFPAFELARRHPASVRSILLNSPFPPNSPNRAEQFSTTAEGLAALQARCDADEACSRSYPDMRGDAARAIARLNRAPLRTGTGQVSGMTFLRTSWTLLVQGRTARMVPELLKRAAAGDDATVLKVAAPFAGPNTWGTFSHAQSWLVGCHDIYPRPSADAVRAAMSRHAEFAQDIDPAEQDTVCDVLQPGRAPDGFYSATPVPVPALVYAGEFDPATPASDATAAMAMLPNGTLASIQGASHAPLATDACTLEVALGFLDAPAHAPDTSCLAARPVATVADAKAFDEFLKTLP